MTELWTEGCSQDRRGGKEGGSALFHRDPRPARYRPPESIPCWDIIPFNQGWLPDWSNKGQGGVRAAASREAGPTQTHSHGSENQRQRDRCHRCPPIYTPPPTHPPINKYHTAPFMPMVFAYASSSWSGLVRRMLRPIIINTPLFLWCSHPNIGSKTSRLADSTLIWSDRQMVESLPFSQWRNMQPLWKSEENKHWRLANAKQTSNKVKLLTPDSQFGKIETVLIKRPNSQTPQEGDSTKHMAHVTCCADEAWPRTSLAQTSQFYIV